jgi:[protein-PII] uridylyltransferase
MGDSRYVVEPNVKEGKGGLRDLHTCSGSANMPSRPFGPGTGRGRLALAAGAAPVPEAERFLWAVRCHLHIIAGRAEERLTFDYQREIAARMNYADRPGKSPVERFMRHYFLTHGPVGT